MNLLKRSLELDIQFLKFVPLPLGAKLIFILKKYILLIKNMLSGFTPGKSSVKVMGREYFFEDKFGIAFLQSVFVDHYFLGEFIKPGAVVVDIGANIGQFNFFCKSFLKSSPIFSFEPVPRTFALLQKNSPDNACYECAITTQESLTLHIPDTSLMASVLPGPNDQEKVVVKGRKLDDIPEIKALDHIDLLKIDAEGAEYDVLKASAEALKKSKYIFVEVSVSRVPSPEEDFFAIVKLVRDISPGIQLVHVGRQYFEDKKLFAIDMMFAN
jgi:FkbM family methyltransferase